MEDKLAAMQQILDSRQSKIDQHERELAELRVQVAVMVTKQETLVKKLDGFSSGINRGLWIIGGGFLAAIVVWITNGGLGSGQ